MSMLVRLRIVVGRHVGRSSGEDLSVCTIFDVVECGGWLTTIHALQDVELVQSYFVAFFSTCRRPSARATQLPQEYLNAADGPVVGN
jgi:hypothetical protein